MGYWSEHPLGGDDPQDQIANFIAVLFPEMEDTDELTLLIVQKEILGKLEDIAENPMDYELYDEYILPFLIAEFEIQIKDRILSDKIKNLIDDAGSYKFSEDIPDEDDEDYPVEETNWNDLSTCFDHGRKLYDLWDKLMSGETPFDEYPSEGIDSFDEDFFQ